MDSKAERADRMAPAVSGFTSSGVGEKVALSGAILLADRDRLRAAIEQHRDEWPDGIGDPTEHDVRLWAALGDLP